MAVQTLSEERISSQLVKSLGGVIPGGGGPQHLDVPDPSWDMWQAEGFPCRLLDYLWKYHGSTEFTWNEVDNAEDVAVGGDLPGLARVDEEAEVSEEGKAEDLRDEDEDVTSTPRTSRPRHNI